MDQMTYGEVIADRLTELRQEAARERAAKRLLDGYVPAWRLYPGRFLVWAGERMIGCAELAHGEVTPNFKVVG
jgi:hypothetical protein